MITLKPCTRCRQTTSQCQMPQRSVNKLFSFQFLRHHLVFPIVVRACSHHFYFLLRELQKNTPCCTAAVYSLDGLRDRSLSLTIVLLVNQGADAGSQRRRAIVVRVMLDGHEKTGFAPSYHTPYHFCGHRQKPSPTYRFGGIVILQFGPTIVMNLVSFLFVLRTFTAAASRVSWLTLRRMTGTARY